MPDNLRIVQVNGHYEVYINGEYYCSADSMIEAINEVENHGK